MNDNSKKIVTQKKTIDCAKILLCLLIVSSVFVKTAGITYVESTSSLSAKTFQKNWAFDATEDWTEVTVKKGDSLSSIFDTLKIHSALKEITKSQEASKYLQKLYPGQKFRVVIDDTGLKKLALLIKYNEKLTFSRAGETYTAVHKTLPVHNSTKVIYGNIEDSFFLAGALAGLNDQQIMDLTYIFGWDIDFVLNIRKGDSFRVVIQESSTKESSVVKTSILAAEFVNQGKKYRALKYVFQNNESSYYTVDGKSVRKSFLKAPLDYTRVSSHFNLRRLHPILHKIRAHKGVDYAAPSGTKVKTTGDGRVTFMGIKKGYGRTVEIQHNKEITTVYSHLSRFGKNIKRNKAVKQGQVIGYVGMTGMATGPHLHYEFRINKKHMDPVKLKHPSTEALAKTEMARFKIQTKSALVKLLTPQKESLLAYYRN
ncbi:MAG: peptidoglycan DD-metalloendopeptidase family protein [Pseudomonadota bacterium]